jgi:hypothetical protein
MGRRYKELPILQAHHPLNTSMYSPTWDFSKPYYLDVINGPFIM